MKTEHKNARYRGQKSEIRIPIVVWYTNYKQVRLTSKNNDYCQVVYLKHVSIVFHAKKTRKEGGQKPKLF